MNPIRILILPLFVTAAALLSGFASISPSSTEPLSSAAGFRVSTPETAARKQICAVLPPCRIQFGDPSGKSHLRL